ncbi:MAG: methyltransferase domain-containing protein [Anaerolineae bacterium]|jgi:ubiquinone/menaquinone biosynthesis C-methylase UbiE|nr:methyltransferase domain-containing protein [Anaerolineae bacterium]
MWRRFVRFGFRVLYREMAWTYDLVSWLVSGGEWRAWTHTALAVVQPKTGERVMEVAHGTGHLLVALQSMGVEAWGVDYSAQMGRIARQRTGGRVGLARAMGEALPFGDAVFDGLVCTFPSDFVLRPETLREFRRVLRPEGRGAIVLHGVRTRGGIWMRAMDGLFRVTGQGHVIAPERPSDAAIQARYGWVVEKLRLAGLTGEMRVIETARGYALVLGFRPAGA